MQTCTKCGQEAKKLYDCEHTNDQEYCVECYTELHYYLTEPAQGQDLQDGPDSKEQSGQHAV
ncbi:MAG TPA: hypothetical protein VJ792_05320 [Candidatus Nitrosotalea sp.]|nr:hypothetical protein [Candidatus Nitrosotalea sp.]